MATNHIEILYDISMAIGLSLNRQKMLTTFLSTFLRKTSSSECLFLDLENNHSVSFPKKTSTLTHFQTAQGSHFFGDIKRHQEAKAGDKFIHCFRISQSGYLLIARSVSPLDPQFVKMMRPIQTKLDTALASCDQNFHLQKAMEDANKANQAKSQFLANMSHEIRTPLNGVLGSADLLMLDENNPDKLARIKTIVQSGNFLLSIINEILEFSRIEAGKVSVESINYSPSEVISYTKDLCESSASDKGLQILLETEAGTPDFVSGDMHKIKQVLINLVGNAIKFTPYGSITIGVAQSNDMQSLIYSVKDTGVGIPSDKIDSIFDTFNQVDVSDCRKYGGSGLGLSICKNLAAIMKGHLSVTSMETKGSTFALEIPLQVAEASETHQDAHASSSKGNTLSKPIDQLRVLLVEDNLINREVASSMLEKLGCSYETAENGQQAVEKNAAHSFDVILMDCQMPVLDGFEATQVIRSEQGYQGQIIALTANAFRATMEKCLASGMNAFLSKPLSMKDLETVLSIPGEASKAS